MGLSFGKLLLLAAVIFIVWYVVKRPNLVEAVTRAARREMTGRRVRPAAAAQPASLAAEDLVKCERCGTYVADRDLTCGRADCPRRR